MGELLGHASVSTTDQSADRQLDWLRREEIDSAAGRLVLHVFGALAEFERAPMLECTMAGLAAARARGRPQALSAAQHKPTPKTFGCGSGVVSPGRSARKSSRRF